MVVVNGVGCVVTGAKLVLMEMVRSAAAEEIFIVFASVRSDAALDRKNVIWIYIPHVIIGRLLRLPWDLVLALAALFGVRVLNLSHYGICVGGKYLLYMHNPLLLEEFAFGGFAPGQLNFLKTMMFHSCLRHSKAVLVQGDHVRLRVEERMRQIGPCAPVHVLPPRTNLWSEGCISSKHLGDRSSGGWFYPASGFAHKRAMLALQGWRSYRMRDGSLGLVITDHLPVKEKDVFMIGRVEHKEVLRQFKESRFLLFTSAKETLGLPLLEAMYFGLPAVLPDLPYAREIYGDAAIYFDSAEPDAVASAMLKAEQEEEALRRLVRLRLIEQNKMRMTWREHWHVFDALWGGTK